MENQNMEMKSRFLTKKRVVLIAAIVVFVVGRIHRSSSMWMLTSFLTILGGGYRPVMECPEIQACIDV